jgi:hypothetical protein
MVGLYRRGWWKAADDTDTQICAQHQLMALAKITLYLTQSCGAKTHLNSLESPPLGGTDYIHRDVAVHPCPFFTNATYKVKDWQLVKS